MASLSLSLGNWRPVVRHVDGAGPREVAITIDDAPTSEATPGMLDMLRRFQMKATFFVSGFRAEKSLELVGAIIKDGHAVYAHGWDHIRLDRAPKGRLIQDMSRCEELLAQYRPTPSPYLVRLPYNGGYRNSAVHRQLQSWMPGCQIAHWRLSTEDHAIASAKATEADIEQAAEVAVRRVLDHPDLPGAVILMHDQPVNDLPEGGVKAQASLAVMRHLVEGLAARGMVSVCLRPLAAPSFLSRFVFA